MPLYEILWEHHFEPLKALKVWLQSNSIHSKSTTNYRILLKLIEMYKLRPYMHIVYQESNDRTKKNVLSIPSL